MSRVQVVNLSYVEFDPTVDEEVRLDTRARCVLDDAGRVRVFARTENFRDYVLPELIGDLPGSDDDGRQYLAFLQQHINGVALAASSLIEMDEAEALEGFPFEYVTT